MAEVRARPRFWRLIMALRELRAQLGRHAFHAFCLAIGIAAYAGTVGFSGRVSSAVDGQTRALLGADFEISATQRLAEDDRTALAQLPEFSGLVLVEQTVSMAKRPTPLTSGELAPTRLVEVEAMGRRYAQWAIERDRIVPHPSTSLAGLQPGEAVVEDSLLEAWKLKVAAGAEATPEERVQMGGRDFVIRGRFNAAEAEQSSGNPMRMGPKIYIRLDDADRAGLTGRGTRYQSRVLLDVAPGVTLERAQLALENQLEARNLESTRVRSFRESASNLSTPLRNLGFFLEQIALGVLALAILGSATSLTAYLRAQAAAAYVLRCLGCSPRDLAWIYGSVIASICLVGTLTGLLLGGLVETSLAQLMEQLLRTPLSVSAPRLPLWLGGFAAFVIVSLATLPTLAGLAQRKGHALTHEQSQSQRRLLWLSWAGAVAMLVLVVIVRAPTLELATYILGGLAGALLSVWGLALVFLMVLERRMDNLRPAWKIGAAQLLAQRGLSGLLMTTIGCAVFLVVTVLFVRNDLITPLQTDLPEDRPTTFLIGVASDERAPLTEYLTEATGEAPEQAPMVQARLLTIDGESTRDTRDNMQSDGNLRGLNRQRSRSRFHRLTYRWALQPGESLHAGAFWQANDTSDPLQASVEARFAERIGAKLGSRLAFDIQGIPVEVTITSLRDVDWAAGRPNFFIVLHPEALRGAPAQHVMALNAGDEAARQRLQSQVVERFPSVTVIDVSAVLDRMATMMDSIVRVTTLMATLVLIASLSVLGASILAARHRKMREFAVLRTLGAGRSLLLRAWFAEFFLLGFVASSTSAVAAVVGGQIFVDQMLKLPADIPVVMPLAIIALSCLACILIGSMGSLSVLGRRPSEQLREQ